MLVFILILTAGVSFFVWEFFAKSDQWVVFSGSPHVYETSSTGSGTITDRAGTLLLDTRDGRVYAVDREVRKATLHWLGDRQGNISTQVIADYVSAMTGFDHLDGVYAYGNPGGTAMLTISSRVQTAAKFSAHLLKVLLKLPSQTKELTLGNLPKLVF
jgi:peptidoglycan glycosyltransferase